MATPMNSVADVVAAFQAVDRGLPEGDGLKWFNWLYLTVTQAVQLSIGTRTRHNPEWLARLDIEFAKLYLDAIASPDPPQCWRVLMDSRHDSRLARIQFALAGMNAHIDHDLPIAVTTTCRIFGIAPVHASGEYLDYCDVNHLLDGIIDQAKSALLVGLMGNPLPCINRVEDLVAMWGLRATREAAWTNSELLWHAHSIPGLADRFLQGLDNATALAGRGLMAPVGI